MSEKKALRDAFGEELIRLGRDNEQVVLVSADLEDATKAIGFRNEFPDRSFSVGIAEQDLIGTAVGLSKTGLIPIVNSFAVFLTNRPYDQIRMLVCYNNNNVKLVATHAGITVGPDGGSAQSLEDIALMRVLPNMTVVCPCDAIETKKATKAIIELYGPAYLRLARPPSEILTNDDDKFIIGEANILKDGTDVSIIACGLMVLEAIKAAKDLEDDDISVRVINMHTIKPIDKRVLIQAAVDTGAIVTAEEHQINAGLGSAVSEIISRNHPVPIEMVAVNDSFGESGTPEELLKKYGLTSSDIINAVKKVLSRKKSRSSK